MGVNDDLKLGPKGLALVESFEGCVLYVYDDLIPPVNGKYREWKGEPVKGTLTCGYGHTNDAKHPLKITLGLRITAEQAADILDVDMDGAEESVHRLIKARLTQGQYDCLSSFCFNVGEGGLANIAARINRGAYDEARSALDLYVKSKGQTLRGLQRRRDAEQALWDEGDYLAGKVVTTVTIDTLGHHKEITGVTLPVDPQGVDHPAQVDDPPIAPPAAQDAPTMPSVSPPLSDTAIAGTGLLGALIAILKGDGVWPALAIICIAGAVWVAVELIRHFRGR